jgi:hypothetical protein
MGTESKYLVSHHKNAGENSNINTANKFECWDCILKWFTNCFSAHSEFSLINIRRVITIIKITFQQMVLIWLTDAEQLAEARLFSLISWKISSHLEVESGPLQVNTQHSLGYTGDEPRESCSRTPRSYFNLKPPEHLATSTGSHQSRLIFSALRILFILILGAYN